MGLAARGLALLTAGGFVALLVYGVLAQAPDTSINDSLAMARPAPAPAFELDVLERGDLGPALERQLSFALADDRVALRELGDTPVVLNFWASWCIPCREEAPVLERAWREAMRPHGVAMVGLNMQDVTEDARGFLREFSVTYLNLRDRGKTVAPRYGLTGIPETFFIAKRGRIVGHVIGAISRRQLEDGIRAAQGGRVLAAREGGDRRPTR
jgi:cytochrome c biogenesis protein CcmG/thiol:disulfide interchange protein DsbE